eukprot:1300033-Prymnesium_polylepis.2
MATGSGVTGQTTSDNNLLQQPGGQKAATGRHLSAPWLGPSAAPGLAEAPGGGACAPSGWRACRQCATLGTVWGGDSGRAEALPHKRWAP